MTYSTGVNYLEVLNTVIQEGITDIPKVSISGKRSGVVFAVRNKYDFNSTTGKVKGFIVTSKQTLSNQLDYITHWTPNVYRYGTYSDDNKRFIKGFSESNLQQINCFVFETDSKDYSVGEIILACEDARIGTPTMIVESQRGYHIYFVLEQALYVNTNNVTSHGEVRAIFSAKRIANNLKRQLSEIIGVDEDCNAFGFFRAPNKNNIVWFSKDMVHSFKKLMDWSKDYETDRYHDKKISTSSPKKTNLDWLESLINNPNIKGEKGQYGRNNILFTIALSCMSADMSKSATYDILDQFNSNLFEPLHDREVKVILSSAFSGRYKGAASSYIKMLQELYGVATSVSSKRLAINKVWYKHKKERKDRIRSHYKEWENDIIRFIEKQTQINETFIWYTQKEICQKLSIPMSSLNEVLKQSKKIIKKVTGKGRASKTGWSTVTVMLRNTLNIKRTAYLNYLHVVQGLLIDIKKIGGYDTLRKIQNSLIQEIEDSENYPYQTLLRLIE